MQRSRRTRSRGMRELRDRDGCRELVAKSVGMVDHRRLWQLLWCGRVCSDPFLALITGSRLTLLHRPINELGLTAAAARLNERQ